MNDQKLLIERIRELTILLKNKNIIICIYPFSSLIKELIKLKIENKYYQRLFASSIKETMNFLKLNNKKEFYIFISENLKDGKGTKLIMDIKKLNESQKCLILLNGKDENNLNIALQLKANAIVHEESLEDKNGALVKAIKKINIDQYFLDPKFQEIIKENQLNIDSNLTKRHIEIIKLVQEGLTNQEIASILLISPNTVRDHLKEIMRRLNTNSRTGVINICLRIGII